MNDNERVEHLSKLDRLTLINQFLILEVLYPEEAGSFAEHRKALERGFTLHYDWMFSHLYDELPVAECKFVLDVLDMYRALTFGYRGLSEEDQSDIPDTYLRFPGFDGNNESHHLSYAHYFIVDLGRYEELHEGQDTPDFNSHGPTLWKYRAMLAVWQTFPTPEKFNLSKNALIQVLEAR